MKKTFSLLCVLLCSFTLLAQTPESKNAPQPTATPMLVKAEAPPVNEADLFFNKKEMEDMQKIDDASRVLQGKFRAKNAEQESLTLLFENADKELLAAKTLPAARRAEVIRAAAERRLSGLMWRDALIAEYAALEAEQKKLQERATNWTAQVKARANCPDCIPNFEQRRLIRPQAPPPAEKK